MVKKFFNLLSIEFTDLEDGIETLIKSISERYDHHEITDYVMKENSALLKRELADIVIIHSRINEMARNSYPDIEKAAEEVIAAIYKFTGIPEVVHSYMEKRVNKVIKYIKEV